MKRFDPYLPVLGVVALIVLWYVAVWAQVVDPVLLPPPTDTFRAMWTGMTKGKLGSDFMHTVERTVYATAIAAVIAIPLGIFLGASERLYRSVEFVIDFFRSTPASAMFPLFLVLFGVGDRTKISVAAFGAALVILFNVAYGVMNARKTRLLAAKAMGASRLRILMDVSCWSRCHRPLSAAQRRLALVIVVVAGVHRLHRRPRQPGVRGAAAVRDARHAAPSAAGSATGSTCCSRHRAALLALGARE
jgi:NitT/TauT family transport system permease protein